MFIVNTSHPSIKKIIAFGACTCSVLAFVSCGGNGVGGEYGWLPMDPTGYEIVVDTTKSPGAPGTTINPGVFSFLPSSVYEAKLSSPMLGSTYYSATKFTYTPLSPNTVVISCDWKHSAGAPTTTTYNLLTKVTLVKRDEKTKYIMGRCDSWAVSQWTGDQAVISMGQSAGVGPQGSAYFNKL